MEKSYEDVQTLLNLAQALNQQVADADSRISEFQLLTRHLVSREQYEELCADPDGTVDPPIDEQHIIDELHKHRLQLAMDLQKQDFVTEKLTELIDQSKGIIDSVKEFFQQKETLRREDAALAQRRISHFEKNIIDPKVVTLDENVGEIESRMRSLESMFRDILASSEQANETLLSEEFQHRLDLVVASLNGQPRNLEDKAS